MGTRSRIAIQQNDGTYKSIYCDSDSYLKHNGVILNNEYKDPMKINLLISLGDLSRLGEHVFPDTSKQHNFYNPQCDVCVAYHRDRGEEKKFEIHTNINELLKSSINTTLDYLYIYEDSTWKVAELDNKDYNKIQLNSLVEQLKKENLLNNNESQINVIDNLAWNLVKYAKDFDTYDFNDCYDSDEHAFNLIKKDLCNLERAKSFIDMLGCHITDLANETDLSDPEMSKITNSAFSLIKQVNAYCIELEKTIMKDEDLDM